MMNRLQRFFGPSCFPIAVLLMLSVGVGCVNTDRVKAQQQVRRPASFDHSRYDQLLKSYVDERGLVDYKRLKKNEETALDPYLQQLAATDPSHLSKDEQLAFWLNAYNALALKLVVDNYPVKSIRRITPVQVPGVTVMVPGANDPFDVKVGYVGGKERMLNEIEHKIIRAQFVGTKSYDQPRVHFALVCAAMSCPPLRREAYTGAQLKQQLDEQARRFLHNRAKNAIPAGEGTVQLSKIFDWFQGDFGGSPAKVQQFIAAYFEGDTARALENGSFKVTYRDYDWTLNGQAKAGEMPAPTPLPTASKK